jgi:signal peptidase I
VSSTYENRAGIVHDRKCELVYETLRSFGTVRIRVTGRSMLPSIWPGDTLVIERRDIHEVAVGDILLYRQKQRLLAHRVISVSHSPRKLSLRARGDALPEPDYPVSSWQVLGTVSRIVRHGKYVCPPAHLNRYERLIGMLTWRSDWLATLAVVGHAVLSAARGGGSRVRAT